MSGGKFTRHIQDMRQRVDVLRGLATQPLIPQDSYPCEAARSDLLTNGGASQALLAEACEKLETALEELQVLEEELSAACEVAEAERQRYEDLFEFAPDAYLVTDGYGMIREANYAAARLLNAAQSFLVGKPLSNFVARSQRRSFRSQLLGLHQRIKPLKHGSSRDKQEWEVHLQPCQERLFDAALTVAAVGNREGKLVALRWLVRDVTERKQAEANLLHQAFHDPLTGLPNRALFLERVGRAIERAKRHKDYLFAVLFLDLDRFKVINDSLGHLAGDQLLKAIAHRLQSLLRSTDTVARLGGDEFTILLEDIKVAWDAAHKATQIQQKLASPLKLLMPTADGNGQEVFITASIGIVLSNSSYNHPEELLRNADIAMYRAKVLGKARHEIFTTGMHTRVVALLQLQNDLRRALERQEFCLYYQPIVLLETEQLIGFEALLRWQHPNRGLISPVEFIATAEETGLIIPIGYWVLQQACRQMCTWQRHFPAQPPLTISVNLSSKQFAEPELLKQVEEILQQTGIEVSTLKLEITENVLMAKESNFSQPSSPALDWLAESTTATLLKLRALGVQVQIDDFGTGYCSLSYLHRFAINALKIDRSFISTVTTAQENKQIVQAIVRLAENMGLDVILEGVETAEQLLQLKQLKCRYAQGNYFAPPLDGMAVEALLRENSRP